MNPTSIISVCIAGVSVLFVIINFARSASKDNDSIKESLLKANMKLDQVCATTNETRTDIKSINNKVNDLEKEVEVVKRDVKVAFHLIDELKTGGHTHE